MSGQRFTSPVSRDGFKGLRIYSLIFPSPRAVIFSPLQETPHLGRNPVYWAGLFLFIIFQIPIVLPKNLTCLLIFRFLTGFVGSPILATGGASMGDIFPPNKLPYAMGVWSVGAVLGPILGPVVAGFPAMLVGWRWPIYELIWMSGFGLLVFVSRANPHVQLLQRKTALQPYSRTSGWTYGELAADGTSRRDRLFSFPRLSDRPSSSVVLSAYVSSPETT